MRNITVRIPKVTSAQAVINQQKWIEDCERNGKSYTGPNGAAIREADIDYLRKLEREAARRNGR